MRPQEVTAEEYMIDPLGRGPKRRNTSPPPPPQVRSAPAAPAPNSSSVDFALFQEAIGGGLQPMFPDATFDKAASPAVSQHAMPRLHQQEQRQQHHQMNGGYHQTSEPYHSPTPSHHGHAYDSSAHVPPSPMQVYNMRQTSPSSHSSSGHGHRGGVGGPHRTYATTGYAPLRNIDREERDPPPQSSSYDNSGSYQRHQQSQQQQYQQTSYQPSSHLDHQSPHSNHNFNEERQQHRPTQNSSQQYQRHDEYNNEVPMVNSSSIPYRREQYHSNHANVGYRHDRVSNGDYNRPQYESRPQNEYDRLPPNSNQQHSQNDDRYHYDHRVSNNERLNRNEHHDGHYSPPRPPQAHGYSPSPRESYPEAKYEEQTSPLSIPSFVGGPPERNQELSFASPRYTSPQPAPFASPQQYASPHRDYPKETIEEGRRRSTGSKHYRHDHYYSPHPPPEQRDDYTGSSTIPTSSSPNYQRSPQSGYHHSHQHGNGESHYQEHPPRGQNTRGCYSVDSTDSAHQNRSYPPPARPSYNSNTTNKQSLSPVPNRTIPRYHQAEENRRQSQARTQILKEIKQATSMRNSAMDDNDRKFWDRQIATLNASFRKL